MFSDKDPIIAKASAAGRGGIGIIRISGSGEAVEQIINNLFPFKTIKTRHAHLFSITDKNNDLIDKAIILRFVAPCSYTGEDVLEIQAHGGTAVMQMIVDRCLEVGQGVGLRLAQPGEFSQRAFLNGRMDLAQAEAVADLIEASSQTAARAAARSMQGVFSQEVRRINQELVELRAYIEATIDFPEEEIDFIEEGHVNERVEHIAHQLEVLSKNAMRGKVLRDGLTVILVGSPNVGKSSLMNALAREEVAIVTDIAGTTRDRIVHTINLDGFGVNLVDTAGVRHTRDQVEQIGIERTLKSVEDADIVLHLSSADQTDQHADEEALKLIRPRLREGVVFFQILNKIDLIESTTKSENENAVIRVSAKTGEGIECLVEKLKMIAGVRDDGEGEFLARARHLDCIARALEHINLIRGGAVGHMVGSDIAAEELRLAGLSLGEIVGQTLADDLLGMIFSKFCIGK